MHHRTQLASKELHESALPERRRFAATELPTVANLLNSSSSSSSLFLDHNKILKANIITMTVL